MDKDIKNIAVCTQYILYTVYTEGGNNYGDGIVPVEKLTERRRTRMVGYLANQVEELKSHMDAKQKIS